MAFRIVEKPGNFKSWQESASYLDGNENTCVCILPVGKDAQLIQVNRIYKRITIVASGLFPSSIFPSFHHHYITIFRHHHHHHKTFKSLENSLNKKKCVESYFIFYRERCLGVFCQFFRYYMNKIKNGAANCMSLFFSSKGTTRVVPKFSLSIVTSFVITASRVQNKTKNWLLFLKNAPFK